MNDTVDSNLCKNKEVPDVLRMNCDIFNNIQYVESNILDPVVSSSTFARWILPPIGFLSPSSRLSFTLTCPAAMVQTGLVNYFLPANIGIFSLINRVEFKSNGKTISNCDDEEFLQVFKQIFTSPERVYNSKSVKNGIYAGKFKNMAANPAAAATANDQSTLMWDSMFEYNDQNTRQEADSFVRLINGIEYSCELSELVPFLQGRLLPLYLMREQLELILHFNQDINYYRGIGAAAAPIGNISIDPTQTKLALDHIIYPEDIMDQFKRSDPVVSIQDIHYQLFRRNLTKDANNEFKGTFDLGGKSRFVEGVIIQWNNDFSQYADDGTVRTSTYYNKYYGEAPDGVNANNDYNIRVNGEMHYPSNITNMANQFSELEKFDYIFGGKPNITRNEFLLDDTDILNGQDFENDNTTFLNNLEGKKSFIYIKIQRFVNNRGLELDITRKDANNNLTKVDFRAFVMIRQQITIDKNSGVMNQRYV